MFLNLITIIFFILVILLFQGLLGLTFSTNSQVNSTVSGLQSSVQVAFDIMDHMFCQNKVVLVQGELIVSKKRKNNAYSKCFNTRVHIAYLNRSAFLQALESTDSNRYNVRITITAATDSCNITNFDEVIDEFITTRPWWIIKYEDYFNYYSKLYLNNIGTPSGTARQGRGYSVKEMHVKLKRIVTIMIERYPEPYIRLIYHRSMIQYPPMEECVRSKLYVGNAVNAGKTERSL
jgi:hypothetical protein